MFEKIKKLSILIFLKVVLLFILVILVVGNTMTEEDDMFLINESDFIDPKEMDVKVKVSFYTNNSSNYECREVPWLLYRGSKSSIFLG